jgi:hypothetical protein
MFPEVIPIKAVVLLLASSEIKGTERQVVMKP